VSPIFGRYEYQRILEAFAARGFVVVAEVRSDGAGADFVEATARQVRGLLQAGVPAGQITVMGFSKGGALALGVSALVAADEVRYAILAGCFGGPEGAAKRGPSLRGRFLSLFDRSDRFSPSCKALFGRAAHVREKTEHVFETDLDHGLFYEPRADWVDRVASWARPDG
jgi:dienelactone hydrolase